MASITLDLLAPSAKDVQFLGEVTSLSSLTDAGNSFDPNGLYSTEIFSVSGSDERMTHFGYIDIKFPILHPKIFEIITSLSKEYIQIMESKLYVKLNEKTGEFEHDDDGDTGYQFFLDSIPKLKFKETNSKKRKIKIELLKKYIAKGKITYSRLLVLPAGLRDYEVTKDGRISEDEINDLYRTVLRDKTVLGDNNISKAELRMIDPVRFKLQKDINAVYDYLKVLIDGKHKFIRGNWIKRGVDYGTRNIFSSIPSVVNDLDDEDAIVKPYETIVGVLQAAKIFLPLVSYRIKQDFLGDILSATGETATLVDPKTMKLKTVSLKKKEFEKWSTQDGIDSIINRTLDDDVKNMPIIIDGYYLKLIYDNGKEIKLIDDPDMEELDSKYFRPVTYGEFLFLAVYDITKEYPAATARHPIIEEGSTYYTMLRLYGTVNNRNVVDLKTGNRLYHYPLPNEKWVNTIGLHFSRLGQMGAD